MDSLISEIKIFDENEMDKTRTFRERLLLIQKRAQESRKESILYKNIKERIETNCERAAYENKNCLYIEDLFLSDFISYNFRQYYEDMNKVVDGMIRSICKELDLGFDGQYITWSNINE
jgi:hypothetical protein